MAVAETNGAPVKKRRFPHVRVGGSPLERGRQYGAQAHDRVHASLEAYERVFSHYAGWDWPHVKRQALAFEAPIAALEPAYLEEMRGIAMGAGVDFEDILGLNVRHRDHVPAQARKALAPRSSKRGECTSFCILPEISASGHLLVGENWDWLTHCFDTVVVLEATQESGPAFVTVGRGWPARQGGHELMRRRTCDERAGHRSRSAGSRASRITYCCAQY